MGSSCYAKVSGYMTSKVRLLAAFASPAAAPLGSVGADGAETRFLLVHAASPRLCSYFDTVQVGNLPADLWLLVDYKLVKRVRVCVRARYQLSNRIPQIFSLIFLNYIK